MVQNPPRTGRPLEFEPGEALEAAMRLFWERGFAATSMEDLEERTGLSRSSLYNTFGSKRELFLRSLERYQEMLAERILQPLERGTAGLDDLHQFLDGLARHVRDPESVDGCLMVNTMTEFGHADRDIDRLVRRYVGRFRRAVAAALRRAASRGEIEAGDLEPRVNAMLGLVLGVFVAARAGMPARELAALIDAGRMQLRDWASG